MDDYEPTQAGRLIEEFVDAHLSNWYVRLCRRRFWKGEYEQDKISAYQTLYECIETVLLLMAPVSPFFSDAIFSELNKVSNRFKADSIHHVDFPVANEAIIDEALEERMQLAQDDSSLVLSLRKKVNIKVRQPLQKVMIPVLSTTMKEQFEKVEDIIMSEVNVKEIEYLTADNSFIKKKIKPNFVALGKKMGAKMKGVSAALAQFLDDLVVGGATVVSCCLLETELRRLATRIDLAQENVTELLNRIELAEVDAVVHRQAGLLPGRALRSLDAIHIVAAQRLDAAVLITYDHRQDRKSVV